ncbi:MAG: putative manganese-dependent inorganic diphosphatase [Opitutaceae bacterium]
MNAIPSTSPDTTYVIGHRNPDADSICSAIAYAHLKRLTGDSSCVAARCGNSNARIDTILSRFNQPLPQYVGDVIPRVDDIMVRDVVKISGETTCAEALELIEAHNLRALPVVDDDNVLQGFISVFQLGGYFTPKIREPREMRHVSTSLPAVVRALKARVLHLEDGDAIEDLYVKIGAMDIRSFGRFSQAEDIPHNQSIIVVGDRWDIQQRSIQIGVRLLVITGNLEIDEEVIQQARDKGVSLVVSPYDSATTAWIIRTASTVSQIVEKDCLTFSADEKLSEVRRRVATNSQPAYMVTDDDRRLIGLFTKTNLLEPTRPRLILVDHNELNQAVPGADQVGIAEIIDHHRLAPLTTQQPILFINEPVGSTCTIVADLFRRDGHNPGADIAGIMMGGIIADTLNLNSPTSTPKDGILLRWLEEIAGVAADDLANLIFSSGSVILGLSADKVVRSDFKLYDEESARFAVSQVEELGFANFWNHARDLGDALEALRESEDLLFAALLVTDINTQNSLLLVKGEPVLIERIPYPNVEHDDIFDLPGIVSRKKQLIPFLTSMLKTMSTDGLLVG